ncbi:hypothetical protein AVEN_250828-1 [Araneus ventricosus]|uniref:DUF4218 domain-containing protein n=1 Tax=Araneus ventricosus TaxID=182803 RepID=A0A4Y2UUL5_ARAVE|nr:hypothetical protein AVEN_250828-1 [Araneus ventricosus]
MYRAQGSSRWQKNRNINFKVDKHMKEISRAAEVNNSLDYADLQLPHSPVSKKIKLLENSQNLAPFQSESASTPSTSFNSTYSIHSVIDSDHIATSVDFSDSDEIGADVSKSLIPIADDTDLQKNLGACFIKHNASHALINDILKILKPYHSLPNDARTLLRTPQCLPAKQLSNGEMIYFGLLTGIKEKIKKGLIVNNGKLNLLFNIDGLPLHRSSNKQFWPILCQIEETVDKSPFPVAVFCGSSKPDTVNDFLYDFVDELTSLKDGSLDIAHEISIKGFVCDAPARAFLKCIKNHNGYFGCEKCCQKGKWDNNRMTFPDSNAPKRQDSDFDSFSHDNDFGHILEKSPLLKVDIGLVTQFPLDYMHMVCLGVMRKLLISWCRGPLNVRLCSRDIDILSNRLVSYSRNIPDELPRKPRSLREIDRWKATEFRMFLLYLGPVVLKKVLPSNRYNHFLILHVAIRILCNEVTIRDNLSFAKELLLKFVKKSKCIYGSDFIVYNVHNLIHLGDDVEKFGPLDSFSTFSFENYLGQLKKLLRTPNKPLQQICRRIFEIQQNSTRINVIPPDFQVVGSSIHKEGTASLEPLQFKVAKKEGFIIKLSENNNCVMLRDGKIIIVSNISLCDKIILIKGRRFKSKTDFYSKPCCSSMLSTFYVTNLSLNFKSYPISDVKEKGILLPYQDGFMYTSLIHTVCV